MRICPFLFTAADKKWERNRKYTSLAYHFPSCFRSKWSDRLHLTKVIRVFLATAALHKQIEISSRIIAAVVLKLEHFISTLLSWMLNTGTCWYLLWCVLPTASQETAKQTSLSPLAGIRHVAKRSAVGIGGEAARVVLQRGQFDSAISLRAILHKSNERINSLCLVHPF